MNKSNIKNKIRSNFMEIKNPKLDYQPNRLAALHKPKPNNESKNANVENQQPPPPPLKPLPPKPSATPSSNAAVYDTSAPKYQRVAHTQKRSAAPQQNIPDAVPVQPPKRKVVIPKEDATPTKKLISKLVNWSWDADNNGLAPVNYMRRCEGFNYRNTEHWKAEQIRLVEILLRKEVESGFKSGLRSASKKDLSIKNVIPVEMRDKNTNERYLVCKCEAESSGYSLRRDVVVLLNQIMNCGQKQEQFLGYITDHQRANGIVTFDMIVSYARVDVLKSGAKVNIETQCGVDTSIKKIDHVYMALDSNMIEGIVNPKRFSKLVKKEGHVGVVSTLYDGVLKARHGGGIMTLVKLDRVGGKTMLIQLVAELNKLNKNDQTDENGISILVTGHSVDPLKKYLTQHGIYPNEFPTNAYFKSNNFMRFNEEDATDEHNAYKKAINSTNIILATIHELDKLKECRLKFDAIFVEEASKITELDTLSALAFSSTSIILFGDKRRPRDQYGLIKSEDEKPLKKYYYRTIFDHFDQFGKHRVINLILKS